MEIREKKQDTSQSKQRNKQENLGIFVLDNQENVPVNQYVSPGVLFACEKTDKSLGNVTQCIKHKNA